MAKRRNEHRESQRADTPRSIGARRSRVAIERATLELSGERGFRNFTVAELLARSGSNRTRFYSIWTGKEECFIAAHATAADELLDRLLGACDPTVDWVVGVTDALVELDRFTAEAPSLAAGLLGGTYMVGGAALDKREEVFARLGRALDIGRAGTGASGPPPRAASAELILSAIEASVLRSLASRVQLTEALPDLLFLTLVFYRGLPESRRAAARLAAMQRP
jgi:AcrR family transcriptional regulator